MPEIQTPFLKRLYPYSLS